MGGVFLERKVVARGADLEHLADAQFVVDIARAAARGRVALDAEGVSRGVWLIDGERVAPRVSARQMEVGVCARLIGRQWPAVWSPEIEQVGVAGRIANGSQPDLKR